MDIVSASYDEVIRHYRVSRTRLLSGRWHSFRVFGLVVVTEQHTQLIHDILNCMYDLHCCTGEKILLTVCLPPLDLEGRELIHQGKIVRSFPVNELRAVLATTQTRATYNLLDQYGIPRTSLPFILFFDTELDTPPALAKPVGDTFSSFATLVRAFSDCYYSLNASYFRYKMKERNVIAASMKVGEYKAKAHEWTSRINTLERLLQINLELRSRSNGEGYLNEDFDDPPIQDLAEEQILLHDKMYVFFRQRFGGIKHYTRVYAPGHKMHESRYHWKRINRNINWLKAALEVTRVQSAESQARHEAALEQGAYLREELGNKPAYQGVSKVLEQMSLAKKGGQESELLRYVDLRPNIAGIGLNLNALLRRFLGRDEQD